MGNRNDRVSVIGAGSWGTALAYLLAGKGLDVVMWVYEPELKEILNTTHENSYYLPGVTLPDNISFTSDLSSILVNRSAAIVVIPSHVFRNVVTQIDWSLNTKCLIVSATKGIENKTLVRMSEILGQTIPEDARKNIAVLSGPSFAREVCQHSPTTVTVAAQDEEIAQQVQLLFNTPLFRTYTNTDLIGVEIGGALKNIIAIAAGACDGLGFGMNTKSALLTRGLAEMTRLGYIMGARPLTFSGLSGMGDLILTCNSSLSRNYTTGFKLGQGEQLDSIIASMKMVAEGIKTTRSAYHLAHNLGIEMPITEQVYAILFENKHPKIAVKDLMSRSLKEEILFDFEIYGKNNKP